MHRIGGPVFVCVAENTHAWFEKARNLVMSLREFGGEWRDAPIVVHFVGGVDAPFERALTALGAEVRVVKAFGSRYRFSNKMRMFDLFEEGIDADVLVALDCDVLVMGDLSPMVPTDVIGIVPAGRDHMTMEQWEMVYGMFDLTPPAADCIMRVSGKRTYPYYNTGVMTIPWSTGRELIREWRNILGQFATVHERFEGVHHENQIAFALAIRSINATVRELPAGLNFSTVASLDRRFRNELRPPFIIHYHQAIDDDGFVKVSTSRRVDRAIDDFNRHRAAMLGLNYPGLSRAPMMARAWKSAEVSGWYTGSAGQLLRRSILGKMVKRLAGVGARR